MSKPKSDKPAAPVVRDQEIRRQCQLVRQLLTEGRSTWASWEHSIANALNEIESLTR